MIKFRSINNNLLFFIIMFETIILNIIKYDIFSEKYFYDSYKILYIMNGANIGDKSFYFTANFYKCINFLGLDNIQHWSILLSFLFLLFIYKYLKKNKLNTYQKLYLIVATVLLNIYVLTLSKDFIQLLLYLIVLLFFESKKLNDTQKVLLSSCVFFASAAVFRTYYIIMGVLLITIYFLYLFVNKRRKVSETKKRKTPIIGVILIFMVMIYVLQYIDSDKYYMLVSSRDLINKSRNTLDTVTLINNIFRNDSFILFLLNYIINGIRIIFPLELFGKGVKYIPFIIYQLCVDYIVVKNIKNKNNKNNNKLLCIIVILSFFFLSIIFEPDFGSIIRHETVLFVFILKLLEKENCDEKSISNHSDV